MESVFKNQFEVKFANFKYSANLRIKLHALLILAVTSNCAIRSNDAIDDIT